MRDYKSIANEFAVRVVRGEEVQSPDVVNACKRYLSDIIRTDLILNEGEPIKTAAIMETTICHRQGESLDGKPMRGKPFIMSDWQVFIVWNLLLFEYPNGVTRFTEAIIEVARKNSKTFFVAALAWALGMRRRASAAIGYIIANSGKQAEEAFHDISYNVERLKMTRDKLATVKDSYVQHLIEVNMPDGCFSIEALRSNPDAQDSFNCNFAICDEFAGYKKPGQYNRFKEAMKAYRNKLIVGITTAGDNANSFGYRKIDYASRVASGQVTNDRLFAFLCRPELDDKGECDFTNADQQKMANPNMGITIDPEELMRDSLVALNDPQERKDFLSRSMNVYTSAKHAWFDVREFQASDQKYGWTLEELAKMGIDWYGGADLSRVYDLTAASLYGQTPDGIDVCITHGWFPITQAHAKADEDSIPLFGWEDDGWLTMCNADTVQYQEIVTWFQEMRAMGFRIKEVGFDRKFATEFVAMMQKAKFKVIDQPQYFWRKSGGFRRIEKMAKDGKFYYLHSTAYEYCIQNVHAVEKTDDMVQYSKIDPSMRIDLFDAGVFACCKFLDKIGNKRKSEGWWGEDE